MFIIFHNDTKDVPPPTTFAIPKTLPITSLTVSPGTTKKSRNPQLQKGLSTGMIVIAIYFASDLDTSYAILFQNLIFEEFFLTSKKKA